jgi:hypothetical protein
MVTKLHSMLKMGNHKGDSAGIQQKDKILNKLKLNTENGDILRQTHEQYRTMKAAMHVYSNQTPNEYTMNP